MRIGKRCEVDEHFLKVMLQVETQVYKREVEALANAGTWKQTLLAKRGPVIARLRPIIAGEVTDGRTGLEYEKTRLRVLPYQKLSALEHGGMVYLTGATNPVIIVHKQHAYHLGPYKVCVPVDTFERGRLTDIHLIPLKKIDSLNRHPHHKAYLEEGTHPLDARPSTCWGSYATILKGLIDDGDVPELFRQFFIYLGRYNEHSPLVHNGILGLDFDTSTPWEAA
jgi:hypothetical protein